METFFGARQAWKIFNDSAPQRRSNPEAGGQPRCANAATRKTAKQGLPGFAFGSAPHSWRHVLVDKFVRIIQKDTR